MKHSIILLETDKKDGTLWINSNGQLLHTHVSGEYKEIYKPQHLYILSKEQIKEGDFGWSLSSGFSKIPSIELSDVPKDSYKVVASTNLSFGLPWIDDTFIQEYIRLYNLGQQLKEVELETICEYGNECPSKGAYNKQHLCKIGIKTKPDGSVVIKEQVQEKLYTKSELLNFAEWFLQYEHGSTDIEEKKKWRLRGGGVYSKCSTIEELFIKFKNNLKP